MLDLDKERLFIGVSRLIYGNCHLQTDEDHSNMNNSVADSITGTGTQEEDKV